MNQNEQTTAVNVPETVNETVAGTAAQAFPDTESERKKAKKAFSRVALTFILTYLGSNVVSVVLMAVFNFLAEGGMLDEALVGSTTFQLMLSAVPILVLCYPLTYLITRNMPAHVPEKNPFKVSHEIMFFLITVSVMFVGNIISTVLAALLSAGQAQNSLVSIAGAMEIVPIIYTVLIAPVVEELVFRKLMLDKLSVYGEKWAIIFSALCFAMFHMNLYQLLYTFGMGLIMGYIYVKSGKIINTIIIHLGVNFLGTVLAPLALNALDQESLNEITDLASRGKEIPEALMGAVLPGLMAYMLYLGVYLVLVLAGIILFIINCRKFHTEKSQLLPTAKEAVPVIIANVGMIVFIVISGLVIIAQLVAPVLSAALGQ